MAHSLGGLLVLDAAPGTESGRTLWLERFVTFGSQAAFFHIMAPRKGLSAYAHGSHVSLPKSIATWSNLWHPLDLPAFVAGPVFRLAGGKPPVDIEVTAKASEIVDDKGWLHSV